MVRLLASANGSTKATSRDSMSYGTLLADEPPTPDNVASYQHQRQGSISFQHDGAPAACVRPLGDTTPLMGGRGGPGGAQYSALHQDGGHRDKPAGQQSDDGPGDKPAGRFRYFVAALVLAAITMNSYANYTMYIAAIEMISNDVLQAGLVELRARHLAQDPLARVGANAAAPGTCPVVAARPAEAILPSQQQQQQSGPNGTGASAASERERAAMLSDTLALFASVHERVAAGQLVDWSISERGYIFTAHTLGTILMALPISRLGLRLGSRLTIGGCILVAAARMWLLPHLAGRAPLWLVFLFEALLGAPGGSVAILAYPMAATWLLPDEANFFIALGQFAQLIGNALTNFVSTQLLANAVGWPWCYYLPGALLTLIGLAWTIFGSDTPAECKFVSPAERQLLAASSLASLNRQKQRWAPTRLAAPSLDDHQAAAGGCICPAAADCPAAKLVRQPEWRRIFTCPTVWALAAVFFAYHWNAKVATSWPTFFANILHLDAATIGILTGLKGVVALLFGSAFAFFTRKFALKRPYGISLTAYRRLNQVLATLLLGLSVALMVLLDCELWANSASVLLTPLVSSFNAVSHEQMPLDLSTEDSGLLMSVIRLMSIGDIPALPVSSWILAHAPDALAGDRFTWRLVYSLGLAIKILACLLFVLVAKSEPKSYSSLRPSGECKTAKGDPGARRLEFNLV